MMLEALCLETFRGWLASRGADEDVSGVGSVACEVRAMLGLDCHQHAFERLYYVRLYFASSKEWV